MEYNIHSSGVDGMIDMQQVQWIDQIYIYRPIIVRYDRISTTPIRVTFLSVFLLCHTYSNLIKLLCNKFAYRSNLTFLPGSTKNEKSP